MIEDDNLEFDLNLGDEAMDLLKDKKERKVAVSITLDKDVFDKITSLKTTLKIESLSPIINKMLVDWIKKNERVKKKKK